ncbi:MAG: hypothetical protein AAF958_19755 [Planctomycetota bacterium]
MDIREASATPIDPLRRRPLMGWLFLLGYVPVALLSMTIIFGGMLLPQLRRWTNAGGQNDADRRDANERPSFGVEDLDFWQTPDTGPGDRFEADVQRGQPFPRPDEVVDEMQRILYFGEREERLRMIGLLPDLGKVSLLYLRDLTKLSNDPDLDIAQAAVRAALRIHKNYLQGNAAPQP